jgi:hypothetical protein
MARGEKDEFYTFELQAEQLSTNAAAVAATLNPTRAETEALIALGKGIATLADQIQTRIQAGSSSYEVDKWISDTLKQGS